jgi:DNA-directed RNA polymerase specialized sigma24 family protein
MRRTLLILAPILPRATLDLGAALMRLPANQKTATVLRYYHGLDHAEIAGALGVAPASVGPLLTRGRSALRAALR